MKHRRLTPSLNVSEVGLGCWQIGSDCCGDVSASSAREILEAAVGEGVTFFDTADVYGDGRSEELIGEFLRETGYEVGVATKLGRRGDMFPNDYSFAAMERSVTDSLRRLQLDCLELIQLQFSLRNQ